MGMGAGFLAYAYGDKIWGRRDRKRKKETAAPKGFYDPRKAGPTRRQVRLRRAVLAGIGVGVMFFFYFAGK
ncbi:MAG: hypothetical protein ACP5DY_04555 [Thermovirgaceae bacterium]